MRVSIPALVRSIVFLVLASTALAIGVGRLFPGSPHARALQKSNYVALNGLLFSLEDPNVRFFDPQTGLMHRLPLPEGETLDDAVVSPWRDERGSSLVVGRWRKQSRTRYRDVLTDLGIACYTFPQGEEVGRIACDMLPQGGMCWYPGTSDRVLIATGDGGLSHYSFAKDTGHDAGVRNETGIQPLHWKVKPPGTGAMLIREPCWPNLPGFKNTILVSLRYMPTEKDTQSFSGARLWWLRLDSKGKSIVGAGPLFGSELEPLDDESAPNVAVHEGKLVLAYVTAPHERPSPRRLFVTPLQIDAKTGVPAADRARSAELAYDCADAVPAFAPDGHWVYSVIHPSGPEAKMERFRIPETLEADQGLTVGSGEDSEETSEVQNAG